MATKHLRRFVPAIFFCLVVAGFSYFLVTGWLDSLYAYRSPLHAAPPAPGEAVGEPLTGRVVFVLIDGLRVDTALKAQVMPVLDGLREQGAWATMHSQPPSFSEPGYSVLLTGAWPEYSDGPAINLDYDQIPTFTQDNLFSAAHRAGLRTAVSGYYWFEKLIPAADVDLSFYTPGEDRAADQQVIAAALPWLAEDRADLVLIHLDQVDYAGHHEGGALDPNWDAAAARSDELLGQIAATLDLSRDTLVVLSDHGHIDRGGHGGQDAVTLVEPFVLAGKGILPGQYGDMSMVDVAPTLAALLGANLPASAQGRVLTDLLDLSAAGSERIAAAWQAQQVGMLASVRAAYGVSDAVTSETRGESVQAAVEQMRQSRVDRERLLRGVPALLLAAGILFLLLRRPNRDLGWMLAAALVFIAAFNLRYAVLDGRTYSLSSVEGATGLTIYCAVTALIAMLLGAEVLLTGTRGLKRGRAEAAWLVIRWSLLLMGLLALPVLLSFAWNGLFVTWTLPGNFLIAFVGMLSAIQVLLVALLGLLLAGGVALVGRRMKAEG